MVSYTLWLLAAGASTGVLLNQGGNAVRSGGTPEHWPQGTEMALDPKRATLLVFTHSHCPCTRATLTELNRLISRYPERIAAHILVLNSEKDRPKSGLWGKSAAMTSVAIHEDTNGTEAHRFGAKTSGFVLFYAPSGQLLFKGGIAAGPGHKGDNAGAKAIIALLSGQNPTSTQTPVYGCAFVERPEGSPDTLPDSTMVSATGSR